MRPLTHLNARSVDEACALLDEYPGGARLNAGGTDLLSVLKQGFLHDRPGAIVNLKTIPGLAYVVAAGESLRIGALTTLATLAESDLVNKEFKVLAEAARSVGTPQIRNVATIGGNLCQDVRCWYYRYPRKLGGAMDCLRKGHGGCLAIKGDNRYHCIMNGKGCFAVCPSDTAVALAALDARIKVAAPDGERSIHATDFFSPLRNALGANEMVTEIEIPLTVRPSTQAFLKYTTRKPVDFAIVSVASVVWTEEERCSDVRIALGAVSPGPVRATSAEALLVGRRVHEDSAVEVAEKALEGARPLSMNEYKVQVARVLVKRALLEAS